MNNKEVLIRVKNINKEYYVKQDKLFKKKDILKAVNDVTFDIYKGEVLGLVGESGCGKSTIGQIISNIISPTSGEVIYNSQNIFSMNKKEKHNIRKKIQIIFQDSYSSLNPKKKIGYLIEEPLKIHYKISKEERDIKVNNIMNIVGLDISYRDKYPSELSGGQRQRVSIAIALMLDPEFIVADESVSALDVSIQAQILNLLKDLKDDRDLTYLFISHDLNVVQYISDRIAVMYLGELMEIGDVEDVYNIPLHPYTKALISSIPSINKKKSSGIILEGDVPNPINPPVGCVFHTRCPYAKDICREKKPEIKNTADGRSVRCHFVE